MATTNENDLSSFVDTVEAILIQTRREDPEFYEIHGFRPFLFFGLRIPTIHRPGLYLHLFIVSLQFLFFFNTKIMLGNALELTFQNSHIFQNDFAYPFVSNSFFLLIPFIVYFCDYKMIRRYSLVLICLVVAVISSFFLLSLLMLQKYENATLTNNNLTNTSIPVNELYLVSEDILGCLSFILFSISFVLSYPFTIAFGLDLLHGTHLETLLLYFPLFFIFENLGGVFAYLQYIRDDAAHRYIHCTITTFVILVALCLFILGRIFGFFKDSAKVANNFSFYRGLKLIFSSLKLKFIHKKKADLRSLMLYVAKKNNYPSYKQQVSRTLSMLKINLVFIILMPFFGSGQFVYQLFPEQSMPLNFLPVPMSEKNTQHYCNEEYYFKSYFFVNPLTIVVFAVVFEFFFNDIVFNVVRQDLPRWIRCIPRCLLFIRNNCLYGMRKKLHAYLTLADPILKRIFWGLPFGLLSVLCALTVEILRIKNPNLLTCDDHRTFYGSYVPLIAQVPQIALTGIQDAISIIGLLQFVYFLCSEHFQNSLKAFFFSLFYFYFGVAGFISNLTYFVLDQICHSYYDDCNYNANSTNSTNQYCFVINSDCPNSIQPNSWVVWVLGIILYLFMIPAFYLFSHYKHWRRVREMRQGQLSWNEDELISTTVSN